MTFLVFRYLILGKSYSKSIRILLKLGRQFKRGLNIIAARIMKCRYSAYSRAKLRQPDIFDNTQNAKHDLGWCQYYNVYH